MALHELRIVSWLAFTKMPCNCAAKVCFSCAYAYAYVAVIPSEDNIRETSVFVLLMLRAHVYAYVAAVLTNVMLMLMR